MNTDKEITHLLSDCSNSGWLSYKNARDLAVKAGISLPDMEKLALEQGVVPLRYQRNIGTITTAEQQILMNSRIAVIGCGGLGGNVVEQLARLGVGNILVWDYDRFEEHNINRQIFSSIENIGLKKIEAAQAGIKGINPSAMFEGLGTRFNPAQGSRLLRGCNVIVDALDNIEDRLKLSAVCRELKIPLVHGAVEGWIGQCTTQYPGETTIEKIYAHGPGEETKSISTPVFTPFLVASLQVAEAVKILLGRGELLRRCLMLVNLLDMDIDTIEIY